MKSALGFAAVAICMSAASAGADIFDYWERMAAYQTKLGLQQRHLDYCQSELLAVVARKKKDGIFPYTRIDTNAPNYEEREKRRIDAQYGSEETFAELCLADLRIKIDAAKPPSK